MVSCAVAFSDMVPPTSISQISELLRGKEAIPCHNGFLAHQGPSPHDPNITKRREPLTPPSYSVVADATFHLIAYENRHRISPQGLSTTLILRLLNDRQGDKALLRIEKAVFWCPATSISLLGGKGVIIVDR